MVESRRTNARVQKQLVKETVDRTTGETITTEEITQSVFPKEPDFVKLYLRDVMYIQDLPTSLNSILYQILTKMEYDGTITLTMNRKKIIAERTGRSVDTINNAITKFVKGKLLERIDRATYRANPYLFGKGEWKDIYRIRMEVVYTLGGKSMKAVIEDKDGKEIQNDREGR